MLSRFVKRHSGFTRGFAVVILEMLLVALIMEVVPVVYADIRATNKLDPGMGGLWQTTPR
jgi:hypothetical protein